MSSFNISPEARIWLNKAEQTFRFLTDENAVLHNARAFAAQSIYPLYIGEGENRRFCGVRLGKAVPAQAGSVCFQSMVHMNEPAGMAGIQEVLDWWRGNSRRRNAVDGDIYLMFAGDRETANDFFQFVSKSDSVSVGDYTEFRQVRNSKTNRNRVKEPKDGAPQSEIDVWNDYQWLERNLYPRCEIILGFHTYSQKGPVTVIPYFDPLPSNDSLDRHAAIEQVEAYISRLSAMMGAGLVMIENE